MLISSLYMGAVSGQLKSTPASSLRVETQVTQHINREREQLSCRAEDMVAPDTRATSAALVSEMMAQGRKSAAALEALLQVQDHAGMRELTAEILSCCDRALAALHGGKPAGRHKRKPAPHGGAATQSKPKTRTRASSGETTRVERKRDWDDGFMWTKYGQKHTRGSDHPRHYFRCAYAPHDGGCPATRHVQRSQEHDPPLYVLTYFADHTCCRHGDPAGVVKHVKMQPPLVLDFGSPAAQSSRSTCWLNYGDNLLGETSHSEELRGEVDKVESTPSSDLLPAGPAVVAQLSGSCSSSPAACDPSAVDWDYFGNNSSDYVREFFDFEDVVLYQ